MFRPYSEFLLVFVPIFFFISGAVSYNSYQRSSSVVKYLEKRVIGLLVPYYLICIVWLAVYIALNASLPSFYITQLLSWLSIKPIGDIAAFPIPVGQVWFLHTLLIISLMSPLYFEMYQRNRWILTLVVTLLIVLSGVQVNRDIHYYSCFASILYKPLVHSIFFIFGFVYYFSDAPHKIFYLAAIIIFCLIISIAMITSFRIDIDCLPHTYDPDLYYVSGSLIAIAGFLILQDTILYLCKRVNYVAFFLRYMHRYTFSIYLLHGFSIYLAESMFSLVHPKGNFIFYGIVKFTVVLIMTCIMAFPFEIFSTWLTRRLYHYCSLIC
jgi:peptidoglycan/LPS O-acetylase OafA/YrhL